jgi:hypothetical protein
MAYNKANIVISSDRHLLLQLFFNTLCLLSVSCGSNTGSTQLSYAAPYLEKLGVIKELCTELE